MSGLALDGTHIYWANANNDTIGRANLDGTGMNQSFIAGVSAPTGLAVDGSYIYWTDYLGNTIGRANLDSTGVNQSFITGGNQPEGFAIAPVPEPAKGLLVVGGVLGLAVARHR